MTLDEAIKHCEEKERDQALNGCFACAEEHKQLAEWLKDYKLLLEEQPQGEWGKWIIAEIQCPNCFEYFDTDCYSTEELNKCPNCGAKIIKTEVNHENRADNSI